MDPIPKIGPNTALKLIQEHGDLENVVESIEKDPKKKYTIPDDWPYKDARELFLNPDVRQADHGDCDFKWDGPDVEGLVQFLVTDKGFSEDRVRNAAQRLQKNVKTAQQARLEGFFKAVPKTEDEKASLKVSRRTALADRTLMRRSENMKRSRQTPRRRRRKRPRKRKLTRPSQEAQRERMKGSDASRMACFYACAALVSLAGAHCRRNQGVNSCVESKQWPARVAKAMSGESC